jgi:hypothetical protein
MHVPLVLQQLAAAASEEGGSSSSGKKRPAEEGSLKIEKPIVKRKIVDPSIPYAGLAFFVGTTQLWVGG